MAQLFSRLLSQFAHKVVVEKLANNPTFQRIAVTGNKLASDATKQVGQQLEKQVKDLSSKPTFNALKQELEETKRLAQAQLRGESPNSHKVNR